MAVNKVQYGNETLIDITDTTATANDVKKDVVFYGKDGVKTIGTNTDKTSYKKLGEGEVTVNTSSTAITQQLTIDCGEEAFTKDRIIYIRIRDEEGIKDGYFYGTDNFFYNVQKAGSSFDTTACARMIIRRTSNGIYSANANTYGVYANSISSNGTVKISSRYSSSYTGTIDGKFKVEVYSLEWPDGVSPYNI